MTRLPDATVGDAYTSTFSWDLLADLVDVGNRMAGQAGEAEGVERVAEAYRDAGLRNVAIEEFEIPGWWRGTSTLSTDGSTERTYETDHEVIALPGTPADEAEGEVVDVVDPDRVTEEELGLLMAGQIPEDAPSIADAVGGEP